MDTKSESVNDLFTLECKDIILREYRILRTYAAA
jgi:hypothetical protein